MRSAGYRDFPGGPGSSPTELYLRHQIQGASGRLAGGRMRSKIRDWAVDSTEMHPHYNGRVEYFTACSQS